MSNQTPTPEPAPEPKPEKEIDKLGTSQPVDHAKLHLEMLEDHENRLAEALKKPDMTDPDNFDE